MFIKIIQKLEGYSIQKRFWILFFIATWHIWVMPILSVIIYLTGLDGVSFFQAPWYKEFLWNKTVGKPFSPHLITDIAYYSIYIYIPIFVPIKNFVVAVTIFDLVSCSLFLTLLLRSSISKLHMYIYGLISLIIYSLAVYLLILGLIGSGIARSIGL